MRLSCRQTTLTLLFATVARELAPQRDHVDRQFALIAQLLFARQLRLQKLSVEAEFRQRCRLRTHLSDGVLGVNIDAFAVLLHR